MGETTALLGTSRSETRHRGSGQLGQGWLSLTEAAIQHGEFTLVLDDSPTLEISQHPHPDDLQQIGEFGIVQVRQPVKDQGALAVRSENPVEQDCMPVGIEPEVRARPLHDAYRPTLADHAGFIPHPASVETEHGVDDDTSDRSQQWAVVGQACAELKGHGDHELPQRHRGQHVIHQVGSGLGHPPSRARGALCFVTVMFRSSGSLWLPVLWLASGPAGSPSEG
jgi:hypothetical protein